MQTLRFSKYFKGIIILMDILVITAVFVAFFLYRQHDETANEDIWEQNILSIALLTLFWILLSGRTKLYNIPRNLTFTLYLERFITHMLIFLFGIILLGKVSNNVFLKTDRFLLAFVLFVILIILKSMIFFSLKYFRSLGLNVRNIMFIGNETESREILENTFRERADYGFKIFDFDGSPTDLPELIKFWKKEGIYGIYIPAENSGIPVAVRAKIYKEAELHKVRVSLIPNVDRNHYFNYELNYVETLPILNPAKFPLDYFTNSAIKRAFDIIFSVLVLVLVCSWLFPIIAILIKANSKGPVFFKQKRYGFHDEIFYCWKFRTMYVDGGEEKTTSKNDKRITGFGKFLRKSSLDELPQFLNVLTGEMSVVGPRPHMLLVDQKYKATIGRYAIRSLVKPGITGLAQVNGLRGDDGDMKIEMQKRIIADAFYVKNWSVMLDFVIILKTVFLLFTGDKKAQ